MIPSPPRSEEALEPSRVLNSTLPHLPSLPNLPSLPVAIWGSLQRKAYYNSPKSCGFHRFSAAGRLREKEPFHLLCFVEGGRKLSPSLCLLGHYVGEHDHSQSTT